LSHKGEGTVTYASTKTPQEIRPKSQSNAMNENSLKIAPENSEKDKFQIMGEGNNLA
jgi:hypothetical protein